MTEASMPPRMRIVWEVLEGAKDADDAMVIAACRRLIEADRLGWSRHHDPADWTLVQAVSSGMTRDEHVRLLSKNPRFKVLEPSGDGFVIVGAKPASPDKPDR